MTGASKLLATGGVLFMCDTKKHGNFNEKNVASMATRLGFEVLQDGAITNKGEDLYTVVLKKTDAEIPATMHLGDVVEVVGLKNKTAARLNGMAGVLGTYNKETGRWA